MLVGDIDP